MGSPIWGSCHVASKVEGASVDSHQMKRGEGPILLWGFPEEDGDVGWKDQCALSHVEDKEKQWIEGQKW